jgi:hypothetical protein
MFTFTFLENGANMNLGNSSVFTEGTATLDAFANSGQNLFSKDSSPGEIGLGLVSDPSGQHEIYGANFVQLWVPAGESILSLNIEHNNPALDNANIFASPTLGVLGTQIGGPLGGTFNVPLADQTGFYIGIASYSPVPPPNTWVGSVVVEQQVPDGGMTVLLLGASVSCLGFIRRKLS